MARRRPRRDKDDTNREPPPLGPSAERPEPLDEQPEIARDYDPGFTPPEADDDPWLDEGRPEASG
jgi:hypothetical protein